MPACHGHERYARMRRAKKCPRQAGILGGREARSGLLLFLLLVLPGGLGIGGLLVRGLLVGLRGLLFLLLDLGRGFFFLLVGLGGSLLVLLRGLGGSLLFGRLGL